VLPSRDSEIRGAFDVLCEQYGIRVRVAAEVDDMAMLRLVARDSGWLTVLPEVVVQDELRAGVLVTVGRSTQLQENFYAITTLHRHRMERMEQLLAQRPALAAEPLDRPAIEGSSTARRRRKTKDLA
jgi:LysR family transcriptional activator of nhaA